MPMPDAITLPVCSLHGCTIPYQIPVGNRLKSNDLDSLYQYVAIGLSDIAILAIVV